MKEYIGHPLQIRGAEEYLLQGGKGNGMRFLIVRNGIGLEAWISLDRAGDLTRVVFKGDNMGFFSPCGHVAPAYYEREGAGFLKSFTAGFFTTCGLTAVGGSCDDNGEVTPLHGTIANIPAESYAATETEDALTVTLTVRDAEIFQRKLVLTRRYTLSYQENTLTVSDTVYNEGDQVSPYMILYHCNMGYPLLTESSEIRIPFRTVRGRNERSERDIELARQMEKPQGGYEECCYYYDLIGKNGIGHAGIYNPDIDTGVVLEFDQEQLPYFTQWKMMGKHDYVCGLEPGNCTPDGRLAHRADGTLRELRPEETGTTEVCFRFVKGKEAFVNCF